MSSRAFKVISANEDYEFRKGDKFMVDHRGDLVLSDESFWGWIPHSEISELHQDTEVAVDYDTYRAKIMTLKKKIAEVEEQMEHMRELFGGATYKLHEAVRMIEAADKSK